MSAPLLSVRDLGVTFHTDDGPVRAVDGVSFDLAEGRTLGIVGESGSGKSVTAKALMNLLPSYADVDGTIAFDGRDVRALAAARERHFWGVELTMVFQDPMTSLNPVKRIGEQIAECLRVHLGRSHRAARATALDLLEQVGIPEPGKRLRQYPHELSGGLRQRVVIAMALACGPRLLIADEPTTALDVTIQAQILGLIKQLQIETGTAVMLITHDMGVVAEMADRVAVLYAGRMVETASASDLFESPEHPYTLGLLGSMPQLNQRGEAMLYLVDLRLGDAVRIQLEIALEAGLRVVQRRLRLGHSRLGLLQRRTVGRRLDDEQQRALHHRLPVAVGDLFQRSADPRDEVDAAGRLDQPHFAQRARCRRNRRHDGPHFLGGGNGPGKGNKRAQRGEQGPSGPKANLHHRVWTLACSAPQPLACGSSSSTVLAQAGLTASRLSRMHWANRPSPALMPEHSRLMSAPQFCFSSSLWLLVRVCAVAVVALMASATIRMAERSRTGSSGWLGSCLSGTLS